MWVMDTNCNGNELFLQEQDSGGLSGRICDERIERARPGGQGWGRVRERFLRRVKAWGSEVMQTIL